LHYDLGELEEGTKMKTALAGLIVSAFWSACASAGTAIADAEKTPDFTAIDADRDGYISSAEAEVVPEIKRIFAMVDTDRDGQLDTSEWSGAVARLQGLG
jgi:Ca2+-binding EF-hand superfamily protein